MSNNKLNPYYITGFTDAEGCFNVTISLKANGKYQVSLRYNIELHHRDIELLKNIQNFFNGIGSINVRQNKNHKNPLVTLSIRKYDDIMKYIIPHFDKYPLLTQKQADFLLFKKIALLMSENKHFTNEGLSEIAAIKASINLGLSEKLSLAFPVEAHTRPIINTTEIPNPYWITGFTDGDGSFFVNVTKVNDYKSGVKVQLIFRIAQHIKDQKLLELLINYFNSGTIQFDYTATRTNVLVNYTVTKLNDIYTIFIPFFKKYPLMGIKHLDFEDFCKVAEIMNNNEHKTLEGLNKIIKIKEGMNSNRS